MAAMMLMLLLLKFIYISIIAAILGRYTFDFPTFFTQAF